MAIKIVSYGEDNKSRGEVMHQGNILSQGFKVSRKRLRENLPLLDPEATTSRKAKKN